tara:strand:- start:78 stop:200 length:123 start_codon:yes stop_codon:yes gene_type:complete
MNASDIKTSKAIKSPSDEEGVMCVSMIVPINHGVAIVTPV